MTELPENIAQTVAQLMAENGDTETISGPDGTFLVSVPKGRELRDITEAMRKHAEYDQPHRRRGTARMGDLASLIAWANRFKGETSVLYAAKGLSGKPPSMMCIADYHAEGPHVVSPDGDPTARFAGHRATYDFPMSEKWLAWKEASGKAMSGVEMGVFLEDNILDVIDPPLSLTSPGVRGSEATDADLRLIDIAARLDGKFGNAMQLLGMAKSFTVNETADYTVANNSTTGEQTIQIKSEHLDSAGQPIRPPKLFLIAIPVFENGPAYRLPVRFQYRKAGSSVKFFLTLHDPRAAMDDAFGEAIEAAKSETGLPLLLGSPEA